MMVRSEAMHALMLASAVVAALGTAACTNAQADRSGGLGVTAGDTQRTMTTLSGVGSVADGRRIFSENCATCHGQTGTEGGVGPSLRGERQRKNYDATIVWIKNPLPPMPTLYPSILSETEVDDVAAYVQSL
jgi:ubiquinol-cytochrome c reductase cytochrome c subunit